MSGPPGADDGSPGARGGASGTGEGSPGASHASHAGDPSPAAHDSLARLEQLITHLVQIAPANDLAATDELVEQLRRLGSPLARSIARVTELVAEQLIAPGIALPPLAMACATLADGVRGKLPASALEAARFEIETLLPMPDHPDRVRPLIAVPDVPVSALRKRTP